MRHPGFDKEWPPIGNQITCYNCQINNTCTCRNNIYYPPSGVPSVAFGNLLGDSNLEMVFGYDDGTVSCYDSSATEQWKFSFANELQIDPQLSAISCSEPVIADLNADGIPEILFNTYGYPQQGLNNQYLMILNNTGQLLYKVDLDTATTNPQGQYNGNGNGAAGAPTVADVNGDGQLEVLLHTFDGRLLMFTIPGSAPNCLVWPTGRGGYLRKGQPDVPYTY